MFTATIVGGGFAYGVAKWILRRVTNRRDTVSSRCITRRGTPADVCIVLHTRIHTPRYLLSQTEIKIMRVYIAASAACDISLSINPFCMMMHEAHSANVARGHLSGCGRGERCPYKSFRQHHRISIPSGLTVRWIIRSIKHVILVSIHRERILHYKYYKTKIIHFFIYDFLIVITIYYIYIMIFRVKM